MKSFVVHFRVSSYGVTQDPTDRHRLVVTHLGTGAFVGEMLKSRNGYHLRVNVPGVPGTITTVKLGTTNQARDGAAIIIGAVTHAWNTDQLLADAVSLAGGAE